MNFSHLARLLELVKRTNDRIIIPDTDSDTLFVLMKIDDYERLAAGSSGGKCASCPCDGKEECADEDAEENEESSDDDVDSELSWDGQEMFAPPRKPVAPRRPEPPAPPKRPTEEAWDSTLFEEADEEADEDAEEERFYLEPVE